MSSSVEKATSESLLKGENVVYAGIGWGFFSLLFFLLFSIKPDGGEYPRWYSIGTYIAECIPFLFGAFLCYRNWNSPQIASGRNVWLGLGLGMLCYFLAGILFGVWELAFKLDPDVSPADIFYMAFYVFVGWGMFLAVLPRRLNLEKYQWAIVSAIAILGVALAVWITLIIPGNSSNKSAVQPHLPILVANSQLGSIVQDVPTLSLSETFNTAKTVPKPKTQPPQTTPKPKASTPASPVEKEEEECSATAPRWACSTQNFLSKFAKPVNFFYIVCDVILLIIATMLLLAFWGGRFSQSWRMIAAATFCLYISDMWFKYADTTNPNYESGGLLEVFYVFTGILFAIGAALEFDVSSRPTERRRRRKTT